MMVVFVELWGGPFDGVVLAVARHVRELAVHSYDNHTVVGVYPDPKPADDLPANHLTWYRRSDARPPRFIYAQMVQGT